MINDLFQTVAPDIKYSIYADDVTIWYTHQYVNQARLEIQMALDQIQIWCQKWGLMISAAKTFALVFYHTIPNKQPRDPLTINGTAIKYVKEYKYLGVTLDRALNFSKHFDDIHQRCTRRLNIMKCIAGKKWGADRRTLFRLYTSLIRPILDYNGFLYDDIASSKISSLQTIQNEALRIITGALRTTNVQNLHTETNIPLLCHRRKYQLLRFFARASTRPNDATFKTLTNKPRNYIPTRFQRKYPIISYRITKALDMFRIDPFTTISTPCLRKFWLDPPSNIHFLYKEAKKSVTPIEAVTLFHEFHHNHDNFTFIYTDGSRKDGKTGEGISSATFQISNRLHDLHSIFTAELHGILTALQQVVSKNFRNSIICTDSASSLFAIASIYNSAHPLVNQIKDILFQTQPSKQIKLLWIPGHCGIRGNEAADTLAKNSLLLPPRNDLPCPLPDILQHIHVRFQELLQTEWDIIQHFHMHPIKPILKHFETSNQDTRLKERMIARLRLGHTKLTHNYLFERAPPPTCHKCNNNTRYTIQHFLIDCPHLNPERHKITLYIRNNNLTLNLPTLLGDDHPNLIDLVFEFLNKTRLDNNI